MKDDLGLYYYPDPTDQQTRVYVREGEAGVEFRLWRSGHPEVWDKHDWLPYAVVQAAADMYKERGTGADPLTFYDNQVAAALIKEEAHKLSGRR